jgi:hypothetical protein
MTVLRSPAGINDLKGSTLYFVNEMHITSRSGTECYAVVRALFLI